MPEVGDIYVCCWGYNQTNVDFFKALYDTSAAGDVGH